MSPSVSLQKGNSIQPRSLRLNRICSDRRSNNLEKWLIEKGYSEREVRKQILRARGFSRDSCWIEIIPEKNKAK